ncbi:MAG: type II 3-dehydroquinate dehydratase [Clostridia bacterium]|nr:type II 3-dehydroquinate dehydratase [Clostridia bacterium]
MKILVINGPNLNMLGIREPSIYGAQNFAALEAFILDSAKEFNLDIELYQSNHEGAIVDKIQSAYQVFDGIVINPAAYTHTSVAILDALKSVAIPTVEVHLSDINSREEFRKFSYVSLYAQKTICGLGFEGYKEALRCFYDKG